MDNIGTWAVLSLLIFFALTSRLKGQSQNIPLWVYFWTLGTVWSGFMLHSYHFYLSTQVADIGPHGVELQSQHLHLLWLSVLLDSIFMALPPIWYLRDKRKIRVQTA